MMISQTTSDRRRSTDRALSAAGAIALWCGLLGGNSAPALANEFAPLNVPAQLAETERRLGQLEARRLPAVTPEEVDTLTQRLEAAEQRLQELEAQAPRATGTARFASENDAKETDDSRKAIEELQAQVSDLEDALEDQADASEFFVRSGTSKSTMVMSGRIHLDLWTFPETSPGANIMENRDPDLSPQDRVGFRRLRFGVAGDVEDQMVYKIEMEFSGGNDVEFRDAYLGFAELGIFNEVLIGNQKRPYGLDSINSSRYTVFLERPFVVDAFNPDARRLGIVSYGFTEDLRYNWRYGVFNLRSLQDEGEYVSDHFQGEIAGRLATTAWYDEASEGRGYLHLGISGTVAHPDGTQLTDDLAAQSEARFRTRPEARTTNRWIDTGLIAGGDWYELANVEAALNLGPLRLVGEYMNGFMQREAGFGDDLYFHGGYVYVSYFLTGEYMPWDRESGQLARIKPYENFWLVDTCRDGTQAGMGAWQVACRGSHGDFNSEDILGGVGKSVTFGLNWYWNANARLQFNYIYGRVDDRELTLGGVPTVVSGDYSIIGTRFAIDF